MLITCPHCGFSRDVPDEKIPPNTQVANCPKCKEKFRFRTFSLEVDENMWVGAPRPVSSSRPAPEANDAVPEPAETVEPDAPLKPIRIKVEPEEDIWDRLESMGGPPDEGSRTLPDEDYLLGIRGKIKRNPSPKGIPFERTHEIGFPKGFFLTVKEVLFQPRSFFSRMEPRGGYWKPLLFLYLFHFILLLIQLLLVQFGVYPMPSLPGFALPDGALKEIIHRGLMIYIVLSPVLLPFFLFLGAGICHLMLLLFRASSYGYQATVRVTAYSTVPCLFSIIPVAGQLVAIVWTLIAFAIGQKTVHQTKLWKIIAVIVILVLLAVLGIYLAIVLGLHTNQSMPSA